jgi:hypothetical protein
MLWIEVLHKYETHTGVEWQMLEEFGESLEASS